MTMKPRHVLQADGTIAIVPLSDADVRQAEIDAVREGIAAIETRKRAVKAEAQRRIVGVSGADDLQSSLIKQLNALMRAIELTNKKASGTVLTDQEAAEAEALEALAATIKSIRSASDAIEKRSPIPDDFTDNAYWPETKNVGR